MANLWNFVQFQLGWFAIVLSAAAGVPHWGYLTIFLLVSLHLTLDSQPMAEGVMLGVMAIAGWSWETLVQSTGWLAYPGEATTVAVLGVLPAPPWMAALWVIFATTLNHSLSWLRRNLWLAGACGAIGGPLAFLAGEKLGAVWLTGVPQVLLLLMVGWSLLVPAALKLAHWSKSRSCLPLCDLPESGVRE